MERWLQDAAARLKKIERNLRRYREGLTAQRSPDWQAWFRRLINMSELEKKTIYQQHKQLTRLLKSNYGIRMPEIPV